MLGNPDDAKDATQTAFVRAYERLATFDEQYRFFSWIYRILMNECLNVLRGRRPEDELSPVLATAGGPYESAMSSERRAQVQAALLQLTPDHRAVDRAAALRAGCRTTRWAMRSACPRKL